MGVLVICCEKCGSFYFDEYYDCHIGKCKDYKTNVKKLCYVWDEVIKFRYLSNRLHYEEMGLFNKNLNFLRENIDDDKKIIKTIEYFKKCYY